VALDDILEPLRNRPRRIETIIAGDYAWAIDYYGRFFVSRDEGYEWTRVGLPGDGQATSMQFEGEGQLGFVVTDSGLMMKTTDAGNTWTTTELVASVRDGVDLESGGYFDNLKFDSSLENGVWIDYCQIFRTSDGGRTWARLADDLQDKGDEERCVANAIYDSATGSWYADVEIYGRILTSGDYLFRSDDDGTTWQEVCSLDEVGLILQSVESCFRLETEDEGLKAAVLALSEDMRSGDTELQEAFSEQMEHGIFVSRSLVIPEELDGWYDRVGLVEDQETGRIWRNEDEQLAYTDDGGKRWRVVSHGMPDTEDLDFSLGPDRGFAIYQYKYLAMSEDLGKTWQILNDEPQHIHDFRVLPDNNRLIVATEKGVSLLHVETLEWRHVPEIGVATQLEIAGPVIWTFVGDGDVHRSTDAGNSWTRLPIDLEREDFHVEAASCIAEQCLLEGYESVARLTADPFGIEVIDLTGQPLNLEENYVVKMVLDARLDRGWAALDDGRMYVSNDAGRTWQEQADLREEISDFRNSPGNVGFLAWGYTNKYLWSGDGDTFESRTLPIDRDASIYGLCWLDDRIALLNAYDEEEEEDYFFASTDGGAIWGRVEPMFFDDTCRVRGGLIFLPTMIATVK
jgi:photosystem II stability/assembly factor-like uncharacterized protein